LNGSVKEPNKFHNYETEKITRKTSNTAEYNAERQEGRQNYLHM